MPTLPDPRVLDVDLAAAGPWSPMPWSPASVDLRRLASWRGGGLSLALLSERASDPVPLVLCVGEGVTRGLPTAARVSVASRSPLSDGLVEGLVGSDFGRRLSAVADGLRIAGRCEQAGAVLVVEPDGRAHLQAWPELRGLSSAAAHVAIEAHLGDCATLSIGPMGERGARIASLAACSSASVGSGPPHFVGRGGLGAVLGRLGLKAIAVRALPTAAERAGELVRALTSSPRLEQRARGGTLELAHALAARADQGDGEVSAADARAFAAGAEAARGHQHGCQGCPTPCGWVFQRPKSPGQAARFGASHALGLQLGLADFDDALGLLARCDALGLDAKEVGAGLALLVEVHPEARGKPEQFEQWLQQAADGHGTAAALADGVAALGKVLGRATTTVRNASVRPDKNLASLLGQCVSARGTDPMRAFPFLAAEAPSLEQLRELCAPLDLPRGAEDSLSSVAKGRLVGWHEDLILALDLSGFCAFSASALLVDGLATLDALALWLAPTALRGEAGYDRAPARAWLAAGAALARAHAELNRRWGWQPRDDVPEWAAARLLAAGMLEEYRSFRADPAAFARSADCAAPSARRAGTGPQLPGQLSLRAFGSLGTALGRDCALAMPLPTRAIDALRAAALAHPQAADRLLRGDAPLPAIYRAGVRVEPEDLVHDGEILDLLLVIGGG